MCYYIIHLTKCIFFLFLFALLCNFRSFNFNKILISFRFSVSGEFTIFGGYNLYILFLYVTSVTQLGGKSKWQVQAEVLVQMNYHCKGSIWHRIQYGSQLTFSGIWLTKYCTYSPVWGYVLCCHFSCRRVWPRTSSYI